MINDIIEDIFKIYISSIDSYNSKIHQTVNDKYTIIDKSMIAIYLFIKIIEERNEKNQLVTDTLSNYLVKQIIYGETGSLAFEITETEFKVYNEILEKLITEKFQYKNRIMKQLKYNYKNVETNEYNKLLAFLEDIGEYAIFQKMIFRGNQEAIPYYNNTKNKIVNHFEKIDKNDYFYKEKEIIVNSIKQDTFNENQYGNLTYVCLNLKEVYRYSSMLTPLPENVLLHSYNNTIISLMLAEYCNKELSENIDIYKIITKSLLHDFGEYKGTEVVTYFKNYNEVTKKMFAEIEAKDEKSLENLIGTALYNILSEYKKGAEGYVSELVDKMLGIIKLWIEVGYFNNYTFIKLIDSIHQGRLTRFLRIENIDEIKNKSFYIELLREYYIYIKEHLIERDLEYFFKYYTKEELIEFREEIKLLRSNPESFLK
ncbi:MAG: HD domain-containing protein [Clostridia bacterium]|nr:HD domain-containing protein [Clostridia bacterium]